MDRDEKMYMPLDSYEKELIDLVEEESFVPVSIPLSEARLNLLQKAAQEKLEALETKKQISLKIRERDLFLIKQKAKEVSIPYQNIIQALLHKYATGQIKLEV